MVYETVRGKVGDAASCILLMVCLGPISIITGISLFFQSFEDHRLSLINEYNVAVGLWNDGPAASKAFENLNITSIINVEGSSQSAHVLQGGVAPEPLGDKSLRPIESFADIESPYFYETSNPIKLDKHKRVVLSFSGSSVSPPAKQFVDDGQITFDPILYMDVPFKWYVKDTKTKTRTSKHYDIDCRKPGFNYPNNDRLNQKLSCKEWCESEQLGTWSEKASSISSSGGCYPSDGGTGTNCCSIAYAVKHACIVAQESAPTASNNSKVKFSIASGYTAYGCMWSQGVPMHQSDAQRQFISSSVNTNVSTTSSSTSSSSELWSNWPLVYGRLRSPMTGQDVVELKISVRHELDPFIFASEHTRGCTSNTHLDSYDSMEGFPDDTYQCFGFTPEQIRQWARALLSLGFVFTILPCLITLYCLNKKKKKSNLQNQASGQNRALRGNGGVIILSGPQNQQKQMVYPAQQQMQQQVPLQMQPQMQMQQAQVWPGQQAQQGPIIQPLGQVIQPVGQVIQPAGPVIQPARQTIQPAGQFIQPVTVVTVQPVQQQQQQQYAQPTQVGGW